MWFLLMFFFRLHDVTHHRFLDTCGVRVRSRSKSMTTYKYVNLFFLLKIIRRLSVFKIIRVYCIIFNLHILYMTSKYFVLIGFDTEKFLT